MTSWMYDKNLSVDLQSQVLHYTKEKKYYIQTSSH